MCIIVDANVSHRMVDPGAYPEVGPIMQWLKVRDGKWVYGGLLKRELEHSVKLRRLLKVLKEKGRAVEVTDHAVFASQASLGQLHLESDDPHIIALARACGARLVYSHDSALCVDFQNPALLHGPVGKIYRTIADVVLLRHTKGCPGWKPKQK